MELPNCEIFDNFLYLWKESILWKYLEGGFPTKAFSTGKFINQITKEKFPEPKIGYSENSQNEHKKRWNIGHPEIWKKPCPNKKRHVTVMEKHGVYL